MHKLGSPISPAFAELEREAPSPCFVTKSSTGLENIRGHAASFEEDGTFAMGRGGSLERLGASSSTGESGDNLE